MKFAGYVACLHRPLYTVNVVKEITAVPEISNLSCEDYFFGVPCSMFMFRQHCLVKLDVR